MQTNISQTQQGNEIQRIRKIIFKILANWYWIVLSAFIAYGYAYLKTRFMPVQYSVSSTLLLNNVKDMYGTFNMVGGMNFTQRNPVQDEIGILKSYFLNKQALENLDFEISYVGVGRSGYKNVTYYHNSPFLIELDSSLTTLYHYPVYITIVDDSKCLVEINDQFEVKKELQFGEWFKHPSFNFRVFLKNPDNHESYASMGKFYFMRNSSHALANQYRSRLKARLTNGGGSILELSVTGANAGQEVDYLNTIIQEYINYGLGEQNLKATNTIDFINKQLEFIKDSLDVAERQLQDFQIRHNIFEDEELNSKLVQELENARKEDFTLQLQKQYLESLTSQINNLGDARVFPFGSLIGLQEIDNYVSEYNKAIRQKRLTAFNLKEGNPALDQINHEIQVIQDEVKAFISEYLSETINKQAFNRKTIMEIEHRLENLPFQKRTWLTLQSNFEMYNNLHSLFVEKRTEAEIGKASNVPTVRVLDAPMIENAQIISTSPVKYRQRAVLIGLLIPIGILLLFEFFRNQIQDINEIARNTRIPIVGIVSHVSYKEDLKIFENSRTPIAESFRILRTNLKYLLADEKNKILTVTSSISGEGKSFSSLNLAAIYAFSGRKTLLVGLDIRKPKVHEYFGINNKVGISTYLANRAKFGEVIFESPHENFYICPSGPVPPNPVELIESDRLEKFLEKARQEFDIVIVDTPPIAVVADGIQISAYADVNLFIVRLGYTNKNLFTLLNDLNTDKNIKNLYLVVNDVKSSDYYGYGHYNYYGRKYYTRSSGNTNKIKRLYHKIRKKGSGYFG